MLHRQQQLYPPGAGAHYRNRTRPRSGAHRAQQRQPALVERANRFDAYGMFVCPRRGGGLWRGAGVDGQQVVVQSRTATQHHLALRAVDAYHFGAHKTRSRKNAQAHQVQMNCVKVIVARHVARQHARVGGVCVGAHQGDSHAGNGPHGEGLEHTYMAVSAADQHQVAQDGLVARLHGVHRN